jgi:hypothetical protein
MLSEENVRQIFFRSDKPDANAVLAVDVDYMQFARNVEKEVVEDCVRFVRSLNQAVGDQLAIKMGVK